MEIGSQRLNSCESNQRVEFAHSLRGIAALSVLISHFCGVFWLSPSSVVALLNVESFAPPPVSFITPLHFSPLFNYGSFGVAVFFLISGFVIPFSVSKLSGPKFLMARIFRIYPVYIFSLGVSIGVIWLLSQFGSGRPFAYSFGHLIAQATLIRGWFWMPSIDGISWTLEIEIVFYVIAAIIFPFLSRPNFGGRVIFGYSILVPLLCIFFVSILDVVGGGLQTMLLYAAYALPFTVFMFTGTLFYLASYNNMTPAQLILGVSLAIWGFSVGLAAHPALKTLPITSYYVALGIFVMFWMARKSFKSNKILDWLADISYPLYAVHAITGYSIMLVLIDLKMAPIMVILVTFVFVILLSWGIHIAIERPIMLYGKVLSKKIFRN